MSRKLKPKPKPAVAKRQPPRWQRERNITLIIWIIIPLMIALALGLVGYWGYDTYVAAWHQPVFKINKTVLGNETGNQTILGNETIVRMDYYVKMLRFYSTISGNQSDTAQLPYQVLSQIEGDELIKRATSSLGIWVSSEEVGNATDAYILRLTGAGNATGPENLNELYQRVLNIVRLSDAEFRQLVEVELLRQKLVENYFKEQQVPKKAKQVHLHAILTDTEEKASQIRNRLLNGEDFTALAQELSLDETSKQYGGDLGWVPRGIYTQLDPNAFSLDIGNASEPIQTSEGYYIVKVSEIDENRPIDDIYREILAASELQKWLTKQRETNIVEYLNQDKILWAMDRIK